MGREGFGEKTLVSHRGEGGGSDREGRWWEGGVRRREGQREGRGEKRGKKEGDEGEVEGGKKRGGMAATVNEWVNTMREVWVVKGGEVGR